MYIHSKDKFLFLFRQKLFCVVFAKKTISTIHQFLCEITSYWLTFCFDLIYLIFLGSFLGFLLRCFFRFWQLWLNFIYIFLFFIFYSSLLWWKFNLVTRRRWLNWIGFFFFKIKKKKQLLSVFLNLTFPLNIFIVQTYTLWFSDRIPIANILANELWKLIEVFE